LTKLKKIIGGKKMANRKKEIDNINKKTNYIKSTLEYQMGKDIFEWIDKEMEIKEFVKKTEEKQWKKES
jgi:hypothetical protein